MQNGHIRIRQFYCVDRCSAVRCKWMLNDVQAFESPNGRLYVNAASKCTHNNTFGYLAIACAMRVHATNTEWMNEDDTNVKRMRFNQAKLTQNLHTHFVCITSPQNPTSLQLFSSCVDSCKCTGHTHRPWDTVISTSAHRHTQSKSRSASFDHGRLYMCSKMRRCIGR